ncbi:MULTISPECIES: MFS transporter [Bacillaceae]|uniref:Major facilitator superfamily (MFS) profile domain-containing protein n=1 Tax=Oceanobacillus indicireducens TaxID=1004261 RepID=A0A917Y0R0_9BACI|nr:MFS transporter [Oceanobacillus indicireducens]GGN59910.1 hypothetical protein GCM10007971_23500 [Oceanobacillus indicireducens]
MGHAVTIVTALHWMSNLGISTSFPPIHDVLGGMTFAIYGALSVVAIFFIWKFVPETKGKIFEELENILV